MKKRGSLALALAALGGIAICMATSANANPTASRIDVRVANGRVSPGAIKIPLTAAFITLAAISEAALFTPATSATVVLLAGSDSAPEPTRVQKAVAGFDQTH